MNSIKGTETEKNLLKSFAGESQARMRYNYFASKAKEEGFPVIASIFEETANHEREHAKRFFKFLEGGMVNIETSFPAGKIGTTAEKTLKKLYIRSNVIRVLDYKKAFDAVNEDTCMIADEALLQGYVMDNDNYQIFNKK